MNTSRRLVKSVRRIELNPMLGEYVYSVDEESNTVIAKTTTQRVQDLHARKKAEGLREIRGLWVHPEDLPAIKALAAKLAKKRAEKGTQ